MLWHKTHNEKGVCKTAMAKPGLLKSICCARFMYVWRTFCSYWFSCYLFISFLNWTFIDNLFNNQWCCECFGKIISRAFWICNQTHLFMFLKDFKMQQRHTKFQKYIWKPSAGAVLAKFNKLTSKTKISTTPWGIYLLTKNLNLTIWSQRK